MEYFILSREQKKRPPFRAASLNDLESSSEYESETKSNISWRLVVQRFSVKGTDRVRPSAGRGSTRTRTVAESALNTGKLAAGKSRQLRADLSVQYGVQRRCYEQYRCTACRAQRNTAPIPIRR